MRVWHPWKKHTLFLSVYIFIHLTKYNNKNDSKIDINATLPIGKIFYCGKFSPGLLDFLIIPSSYTHASSWCKMLKETCTQKCHTKCVRVTHAKESRGPNVSTILLACLNSSNVFYSFQYARQFEINYPSIHPSEEEDLTYSCSSGIWQTQMDTAAGKNCGMNHTTSLDVLVVKHLSIHNGNCWKNRLNTQGTQP